MGVYNFVGHASHGRHPDDPVENVVAEEGTWSQSILGSVQATAFVGLGLAGFATSVVAATTVSTAFGFLSGVASETSPRWSEEPGAWSYQRNSAPLRAGQVVGDGIDGVSRSVTSLSSLSEERVSQIHDVASGVNGYARRLGHTVGFGAGYVAATACDLTCQAISAVCIPAA